MSSGTWIALANLTLTASDSSIEFASIPNTYRDLVLVVNGELTGSAGLRMRVNSDTGANYNQITIKSGGTVGVEANVNETTFYPSTITMQVVRFDYIAHFLDYSATDKHKSILIREGHNAAVIEAIAGRWANTNAINAITLFLSTNSYAIGTTFALFGIRS